MTDPLAELLHDEWDHRLGEPSEPGVPCSDCRDSADRLRAAGVTLVAARAAVPEDAACTYDTADFDRCVTHGGRIGPARDRCALARVAVPETGLSRALFLDLGEVLAAHVYETDAGRYICRMCDSDVTTGPHSDDCEVKHLRKWTFAVADARAAGAVLAPTPASDAPDALREALALLADSLDVQRHPCNHAGIGRPGCVICDPRVYPEARAALAETPR
jgi:hypothetical protein